MRLWPRNLVGQLLLATALALFAAQAVSMTLLIQAHNKGQIARLSALTTARIAFEVERPSFEEEAIAVAIGLFPSRARRAGSRAEVTAEPPPALAFDRWPAFSKVVLEQLTQAELGFVEVRASRLEGGLPARSSAGVSTGWRERPGQRVIVGARRADGTWVILRGAMPPAGARIPGLLIAQTLLIFVILLVPIIWMGWRISRPLSALSSAVTEPVGTGEALTPSGPGDVRDLTAGFNAMRTRIAAMLSEKDRTLGAIGHDLRTPLASLRVRVESVADETLRQWMIDSIAAMTAMLDDIVALARVGHSQEPRAMTDLGAFVAALADDYRELGEDVTSLAPTARITLDIRPELLRRALRNLVDNGLKYGERAELSLEPSQKSIAIAVRDHGPGIPPDRIAAMIEPFARGDASRNRETGGAGLGLALAKAIIEHEGGRLVLENRAGGGLEARIVLPA